jgi:hypothetical protein
MYPAVLPASVQGCPTVWQALSCVGRSSLPLTKARSTHISTLADLHPPLPSRGGWVPGLRTARRRGSQRLGPAAGRLTD